MRSLFFLFFFSTFSLFTYAQSDWCGTDEELQEYLNASPQHRIDWEQQQDRIRQLYKELKNDKSSHTVVIPMVVHVIHDNGIGNISKSQIEDGIETLNKDLQKLNSDTSQVRNIFKPFIADLNIEFRLAKIDPNGICTEGITRTNSKLSNSANPRNQVKPLSRWPYQNYFNVWLVNSIENFGNSGTVLGYAQFPGTGTKNNYGIVVRHDSWGTIGTAVGSDGRTVTHEVGHSLNLLHTFQSGCGSTCQNSGDDVCDTPPVASSTFGCNKNNNSCSNDTWGFSPYSTNVPDMLENFMSYDDCQYMFTEGQKARVMATFSANYDELKDLSTQANLVATGTDSNYVPQVCAPIADIIINPIYRCVGTNITFEEDSYNADVSSWSWSFPGGTPNTSTDSMPVVHYNSPGVYSFSLTVSSAGGSDTITIDSTIIISDTIADYPAFNYTESFENANVSSDWIIVDEGGLSKWEINPTTGFDGSKSFWIKNWAESIKGEKDALISPSYDLSTVTNPVMKFDVAYRKKNSSSSDNLNIYYSFNCGETWALLYVAYPFQLQDTTDYSSWFVPQSPAEWKEISIPLPSGIKNQENVKFKFELSSGGGNNMFFDHLRFAGPSSSTGIEEAEEKIGVHIFPNPTVSGFTLLLDLNEKKKVQIEIKNLLGKTVKTISNNNFNPNAYRFSVETENLASGIYLVNLKIGAENITKKLVVQ